MASRAEEYRRRAQQCPEIARTFTHRQVRDTRHMLAKLIDKHQCAGPAEWRASLDGSLPRMNKKGARGHAGTG